MEGKEASVSSSMPAESSSVSASSHMEMTSSLVKKMAQQPAHIQDKPSSAIPADAAAADMSASGTGESFSPQTPATAAPAEEASAPVSSSQNPAAMLFDPLAAAMSGTPEKGKDAGDDDVSQGAESSDNQERGEPHQVEPQTPVEPTRGGILSPFAGLFGGGRSPTTGNNNGENRPQEEVDDVESANNNVVGTLEQEQSSALVDLEAATEATETASDTACSSTTDGGAGDDQQSSSSSSSDAEDSPAKASPPSSPSNRSATVVAKGSFAATDPCASFGDDDGDDEDWIEDDPSAIAAGSKKKRKAKASDTTAKALPIGSCGRRYKRQMLYCLSILGMMVVFMGAGIAIGIKIARPTAANASASSPSPSTGKTDSTVEDTGGGPTQPPSKPEEAKPADEGVVEDTTDTELEPVRKPNGDNDDASIGETSTSTPVDESQALEEPEIDAAEESSAPADSSADIDDTTVGVDQMLDDDSDIDTPASSTGVESLFNDPSSNIEITPTRSNETDATTAVVDEDIESEDGGDPNAYVPGNLQTLKNGVLLSKGLDCKIIAKTGKNVKFSGSATGAVSSDTFHARPDFGATFPTDDGGWVYVSNSEVANKKGGVGAIYFNKNSKVIDYKMLLKKTSMNCGGGRTPWDTWISCEEVARDGQIWEVDPLGVREAKMTVLGGNNTGGRFESFTYDVRDKKDPRFYYTEDRPDGPLRRFRPTNPDWNKPHKMLHGTGDIEFLLFDATTADNSTGTYSWTTNKTLAQATAAEFFPGSEGIDAYEGSLYFVSKKAKFMYVLDLDGDTWERRSTVSGVFDGSPDQLTRLVGEQEILYYTEEGGKDAGIHGRDSEGNFFSILESPVYNEETTGLAFSPNHKRMYVAYQANGILLDVWRKDGLPFSAKSLNIKYHNAQTGVVRE